MRVPITANNRRDTETAALLAAQRIRGSATLARAELTIAVVSLPPVAWVYRYLSPGLGLRLLVVAIAAGAWASLTLGLIRAGRYRAWMDWVNAAAEVSFPTIVAIIDYERFDAAFAMTSPANVLYALAAVMAALRLKPALVLYAGALAAAEFVALYLALRGHIHPALVAALPTLTAVHVVQRATYISVAGLAGFWLCRSLVSHIDAVGSELAARRAADEGRRQSEESYRALTEHSPDLVARFDRALGVLFANAASQAILGRTPGEIVGYPVSALGLPEPAAESLAADLRAVFDKGQPRDAQYSFERQGARMWLDARVVPEAGADGGVATALATLRDASARNRAEAEARTFEEQLRHSQKMEALGALAGGVSHDFNNLLTAIMGFSYAAVAALPDGSPAREDIGAIQRAAGKASDLTRQLLTFSSKQPQAAEVVDPDAMLESARQLLRRVLGEDLDLVVRPGAGGARVLVEPGQLEQVLVNLAVNARDAMPGGGRLTLETTLEAHPARLPEARSGAVVIAVTDTGCGIPAEALSKIFEPFYTTKPAGKGTGLGLSIAYGIVEQSGGRIAVESRVGRGTTFRIWLPVVDGAMPEAIRAEAAIRGGSETVLLVEDEEIVRSSMARLLRKVGYRVLVAESAEQGLALLGAHPEVALLLTDVVMPRMSGRDLYDRLALARPDLKVLFASGYAEGRAAMPEPWMPFLSKPFTSQALAGKVREVLDAPQVRAPGNGAA